MIVSLIYWSLKRQLLHYNNRELPFSSFRDERSFYQPGVKDKLGLALKSDSFGSTTEYGCQSSNMGGGG